MTKMTRNCVKYSIIVQLAAVGAVSYADDPGLPSAGAQRQSSDMTTPSAAIRASKIIGSTLYSEQDKDLGSIKDIVLDQDNKKAGYLVVSYGGTLGMGGKWCAVPYDMVQIPPLPESKAMARFDEQTLKNAPAISGDRWPTEANAQYFEHASGYYSSVKKAPKDQAGAALKDTGGAIPAGAAIDKTGLQWTRRVSQLIEAKVDSASGERLGEVKDVMLDNTSGDVRYAILSFGGTIVSGDKLFAVPIDQFKTQADGKGLTLAIDKQTLKNAPGFDKEHWPAMADPEWQRDVGRFYQQQPISPSPSKD